MKLTAKDRKLLEIAAGDGRQLITARIQRLAGDSAEKLAVIDLQHPASDAQSVAIRRDPLMPEEPVVTLAYPRGRPHFVQGRFVRFDDGRKLAGIGRPLAVNRTRFAPFTAGAFDPKLPCHNRYVDLSQITAH
jgi:hypothetical protein